MRSGIPLLDDFDGAVLVSAQNLAGFSTEK